MNRRKWLKEITNVAKLPLPLPQLWLHPHPCTATTLPSNVPWFSPVDDYTVPSFDYD